MATEMENVVDKISETVKEPTSVLGTKQVPKKRKESQGNANPKTLGIYYQAMLTRRISLSIANIGGNVMQILENVINKSVCGKCGPEGYIRPNSAKVLNHSAPMLKADTVIFNVTFECLVCNPVEGMSVSCVAKNITKAGIRAEVPDGVSGENTPMVIFVSRDHHFQNPTFNNVQVDETINVKIIGVRFKLNDKYISAIAQLVDKQHVEKITLKRRPKLTIKK
jgi:DNA-directed RNA polymerase subunit E'/Rpb7